MKRFKNILCFLLVFVSLTTCFLPSVGAASCSATYSKLPVIYIAGNANAKLYDKSGKQIWPLKTTITDVISKNKSLVAKKAVRGYATGNWTELGDTLYDLISPLFKPLLLDANGNSQNGVTVQKSVCNTNKTGKYSLEEYQFRYDMRLDPLVIAKSLRSYINKVLKATGKTKVNLVARCMGGVVLSAYLRKYKADPLVNTAVFYSSGSNGVLIEEAPFCGNISLSSEALSQYSSGTGEESFAGLLQTLTNIFGSKAVSSEANSVLSEALPVILPRLLRATYANFPSYWALIGDQFYETAKNYVFNTYSLRTKYAGLIKKIDHYHQEVQLKQNSVLEYIKNVKGVNINIITKYNCKFDPIYDGSEADGDEWIEASSQSFGANIAEHGTQLSDSYCDDIASMGLAKYISSDRKIDASTCLFPDSTWFIKNCKHSNWKNFVSPLLYAIFSKNTQVTVNTYSNFPQFLNLDSDKLINAYNYAYKKPIPIYSVDVSPVDNAYTGNNKTPAVVIKKYNGEKLVKGVDYNAVYQEERAEIGKYYVKIKYIGDYSGLESKKLYFNVCPANVTGLTLSSYGSTAASLKWTAAKGATGYAVYKYVSSSKTWKKLGTTTALKYTVKNLTAGEKVKLAVKGIASNGTKNFYSPTYVSVTVNLKPAVPVIKATAGTKSITLTWAKVNGATSYQIFRSNSKMGVYSKVGTVTKNKFVNTGLASNRTYCYKIRAVKTVGSSNLYSGYSKIVSCKSK